MNKKILKYMLNTSVKSMLGLQYLTNINKAWSIDEKEYYKFQQNLFKKMYSHAICQVPYYMENSKYYPILSDEISCHEFLKTLPIINKRTILENNENFVSLKKRLWCTTHTTSGTTGTPLTLSSTPFERALSYAILDNWYKKLSGRSVSPPLVALSGFMTPGKNEDLYWSAFWGGHLFLNIYGINSANAEKIINLIKTRQNAIFFGYASALAELARTIEGKFDDYKNNFVAVSTSEVLTPYYRELIELHMCRKVYDQYGSQEGSHLALECEAGHMHVHPFLGIVEILNDFNEPCLNGEMGRVVVTGFKKSMPLIRYEIGDSAISLNGPCSCGLSWPIIGALVGRSEDLVITPDGRRIGYLNFHSTKNLKGIVESQLIQIGYTSFVFKLVLPPDLHRNAENTRLNELLITEQIRMRLGYDVNVEYEYLDRIPREGGRNKFKAVVVKFNHHNKDMS